MNKIQQIYKTLLKEHGNQGWWTVTTKGITPQYHPGDYSYPKNNKQIFEVIVGAILTQNTSWKNVEKAIVNLNKENLMSLAKIRKIPKENLARLIRPSGYFNQKAERLKIAAEFLARNIVRFKREKDFWELRKELLEVKGIGPETADSILLYAFKKPVFVIDAYTKQFSSILGYSNKTYGELQKIYMHQLQGIQKKAQVFNEYHAMIVAFAKAKK